MARTKLNQRPASRAAAPAAVPMGATGGRTPPSKLTVTLFAVSIIAALWALAMMTSAGRVAYVYFFAYSEYYMGVLALVSLSITIMLGLVATDRLVISIRQRVLLQSAHRTFGVIAVGSLALHLWTKLMEAHITVIDIFIPFLHTGNTMFVAFGTISGWVMVISMWTGIIRAKFIGRGKPWMWRAIHAFSYLIWPIALVHGLGAGRPAAVWVTVSYVVCVLGVLLGLAVRISVSLNRKKDFASQASNGTGMIKPVGQMLPTTSPVMKRGGRDAGGRGGAATGVLDRWEPAAPPAPPKPAAPVSPAPAPAMTGPSPISAPPYDEEPRPRSRRVEEEPEDDYAPPRQRRRDYDEDDRPAPRQRRREYDGERFDEQTGQISRRAIEEGRRRYEEEEAAAPRSRRRDDDDQRFETQPYEPEEPRGRTRRYEEEPPPARRPREIEAPRGPAPRARRYEEDDRYDDAPAPRGRGPRYPDDDPPARRGRGDRDRENVDRADSGRHSRSEFVDLAGGSQPGEWRDSARDGYDYEPDETPTLVDMASRRARRTTQQQDAPRGAAGRGARGGRGREEMADDDTYWRQLRGEAQ